MALFAVLLFLIDSSLQLMNVTHLARLVNSLEKKQCWFKKIYKNRKKIDLEGVVGGIWSVLPYPFKLES